MVYKKISLFLYLVPSFGATLISGIEELPYVFLLYFFYKLDRKLLILFLTLIICSLVLSLISASLFGLITYLKILSIAAITPLISNRIFINDLIKFSHSLFFFFSIFGFLQFLNIIPFGYIFSIFIERYQDDPLGSYRGVQLLYPEPARASFYYLSLFIIGIALNEKLSKYHKRYAIILLVFTQLFIIKSITGIALTLFVIIIMVMYKNILNIKFYIFDLLIPVLAAAIYIYYDPSYKIILIIDVALNSDFYTLNNTLNIQSGGRYFGILNVINSFLLNPFGVLPSLNDLNFIYYDSFNQPGVNASRNIATSSFLMFLKYFGLFSLLYFFICFVIIQIRFSFLLLLFLLVMAIYSPVASSFIFLLLGVYSFYITNFRVIPTK